MIELTNSLLNQVTKPARYTGGEWNAIVKNWQSASLKIALAYPDLYEIGMSNMALPILYDLFNREPDVLAERVFTPWADMNKLLEEKKIPLFSLESRHPLREFDVIGFSLGYELTFTNVLQMLRLAGIPAFAADRNETYPLIIAGGGGVLNPEPVADFFDFIVIGEAEAMISALIDCLREGKKSRLTKIEILQRAAAIPGVYVPRFYDVEYNPDGTLQTFKANHTAASPKIKRQIVEELPPPPVKPVVPFIEAVHDRAPVEIQRGCSRGCRFCQASTLYRPMRERSHDDVIKAIDEILANTGYNEVSLVSLSSSDYHGIDELVDKLVLRYRNDHLTISLPSLHLDEYSVRLVDALSANRKTGMTFAPEAGSSRLQKCINKSISENTLVQTAAAVFGKGWTNLKLYFMMGLPTETDDDVKEIARLVDLVMAVGRAEKRFPNIRISLSTFVPKPHTPFQWSPQDSEAVLQHKNEVLKQVMPRKNVSLSWSEPKVSLLEAALSRGDRRLARVIYRAWELGSTFDAWGEHFKWDNWSRAFAENGLDPAFYANRERDLDELLPWDHIDIGITPAYLKQEYKKSLKGLETGNCRYDACNACGLHRWLPECKEKASEIKRK
jgi:radical SAM family uncharacterized protein